MGHILATIAAVEKQQVFNTVSVCVVLGIQHATCMCHIVICDLPCIFAYYLISGTI